MPGFTRNIALLALILLLGSILVACQPAGQAAPSAPGIGVGISDKYCPAVVMQAGQQVTWTNQDSQEHIVRHRPEDADPQFESGLLQPGDSFTFTFLEPGIYPYECSKGGAILGLITVEP